MNKENSNKIKVYELKGETYNVNGKSKWSLMNDISCEDAIKKNAGNKTILLIWEEDGIMNQSLILTHDNFKTLSKNIADELMLNIKSLFK